MAPTSRKLRLNRQTVRDLTAPQLDRSVLAQAQGGVKPPYTLVTCTAISAKFGWMMGCI